MPGSIRDYVDNVLFISNSNESKLSENEVAWDKNVVDNDEGKLYHRHVNGRENQDLQEERDAMNNNIVDKEIFSTTTATEDDGIPSLNHPMEKQILKKMDMFLIPLMCLLYFLSNLDKSNIGNAEVAGLSEDIGLKGKEYNVCVTVFFGTYVVFDPIGANLLKIVGPHLMMSICLLCFGAISLGSAWVRNYGDLLAVRLLLGAFEGMIYPAINMYLSVCYRREQYAKRFAFVFSAACLSSSFGGLIAYGCSTINGSLRSWQYIYIIEGVISIGFVPCYYFGLSKNLEDSWFFNKEGKEYIVERYKTMNTFNPDETFDWYQVKLAIKDIKTWVCAIALFGIDLTTFGLTVFLPIIITSLGFTNVRAQLMTVPVYFLTAIVFFICALWSDRLRLRSPFIIGACTTTAIGLAIVLGSEVHGVRYFGVYILCMGIYVNAACNCLWLSGNNGNYFKRATALGINLFFGSGSGLVSGQIFLAGDKPRYIKGLSICLAFQVLSIFMTILQYWLYKRENAKKDKIIRKCRELGEPIPYDEKLSDLNPEFRYLY
ncbi:High-affinity nicotinic acid transporter [Maudiozyma exigua]|uniref:High-affinity nicotinic acid transporter n=1 Tax=Maudiozyma exigua TaxID=34358 RepID=A0A9P6WEH4_MAUEX|nr:High-affinity nicotinic acid transporter [Kazachstania exigua]